MNTSNNMIGNAGEYYVCAELCRRNILALITPKNNPLFDIVAVDTTGKNSVAIQVKTMSVSNKQGWKLGADIIQKQQNPNLYVVLVNMNEDGSNDFYIYDHDTLSDRVTEVYNAYILTPKKDGNPRKDVGFRWFDFINFRDEDYQRRNNWALLHLNNN